MATNRVQVWVNVDGQQVMAGERKTPRTYDYAVIARWANGTVTVESYHRSLVLAHKGREAKVSERERARVYHAAAQPGTWGYGRFVEVPRYDVAATLIVPVKQQTRVQCEGLCRKQQRGDWPAGWRKCTRTAGEGGTLRCAEHAAQDVAAFKAQVRIEQEAHSAAEQAKWEAQHAEAFTAATCPFRACRVHGSK